MYFHWLFYKSQEVLKTKKYEGYTTEQNIKKGTAHKYNWLVYGLGIGAEKPNKIYQGWREISYEFFDNLEYPSYFGLDFGASNPTACVEVKYNGDGAFYIREILYQPLQDISDSLPTVIKLRCPEIKKGKDIIPPKNVDGKTDEEKQTGESLVADFLSASEDDESEEEPQPIEKPTNEESNDDDQEEEDDEPKEGNQFSALAGDLLELGVFTKNSEDEEVSINTPEEFLERFNAEKKKGASELEQKILFNKVRDDIYKLIKKLNDYINVI